MACDGQATTHRALFRCLADARCVLCEELPIPDLKLSDLLIPGDYKVLHPESATGARNLHNQELVQTGAPLLNSYNGSEHKLARCPAKGRAEPAHWELPGMRRHA